VGGEGLGRLRSPEDLAGFGDPLAADATGASVELLPRPWLGAAPVEETELRGLGGPVLVPANGL
jgi:hypothetical protein